jgi:hypothetical protein
MQSSPHTIQTSTSLLVVLATILSAACSSGSDSGTGSGGGSSGPGATSSSAQSGTGGTGGGETCDSLPGMVCPGGGFGGSGMDELGGSVTAIIVDETGAPVADQPVFICGTNKCSDAEFTNAQGLASIATSLAMADRAFKFGDSVEFVEFGIPLTQPMTDFMTIGTGKLPAAGAKLAPGTDAVSGPVTLTLPADAEIGVDFLIYDSCEKQHFRAVSIPVALAKPVLDPVQINGMPAGFELLYGVGPARTTICPAAKVTVALPDTLGWAPNTAVEFWITTVSTEQVYAPYSGWTKASDGVVSADGKTATTSDTGGFVYLDSFAIRRVP